MTGNPYTDSEITRHAERSEPEPSGGVWPPRWQIPDDARVKPTGPAIATDRIVIVRTGQAPEPRI